MSLILMLCIPVFAIGITVLIGSLVTFVLSNDINYVVLLISMFTTIVSGFLISKNLKAIMPKTVKSLNILNNMDIYFSYFNFVLFVLFGLAYLCNYFFYKNIFYLAIGMSCIAFYIYITYAFFGEKKEVKLKVKSINTTIKNVKCLALVDEYMHEFTYYVIPDFNVEVGNLISFNYYKHTRMIKIIKGDLNGGKQ